MDRCSKIESPAGRPFSIKVRALAIALKSPDRIADMLGILCKEAANIQVLLLKDFNVQ